MSDLGYPMIQARDTNYEVGRGGKSILWVIVHCTDQGYQDDYPHALGLYWARDDTEVSVHYGVSDTQVYQYVAHADKAYQARDPGNDRGVGIEFSGLSTYDAATWLTHNQMLRKGGLLVSQIAAKHGIPLRYLTDDQLRAMTPGVTTHAQLKRVFGGIHTDPGPGFPLDLLLQYALNSDDQEEDDNMGASFPPLEIPAVDTGSFTIPPVQSGAADPRKAWINICNDTNKQPYALRVVVGDGKDWHVLDEAVVLNSNQRYSKEITYKGTCVVSIRRVPAVEGGKVYAGHLTWCLERGEVIR